jgi:D-glycero-D-manno-heptose 1,7-bisphosphate phosphatase
MGAFKADAGGLRLNSGDFVLLDRDGVINVDQPTSVRSLAELSVIDGVPEAIAKINAKGYSVLVITNQAVVARGHLSRQELDHIHRRIEEIVERAGGRIDGWYVCDHDDSMDCQCRKPRPGLLLQAASEHRFELADTWFVGDAERDVQAAVTAGCKPALVKTGKGLITTEKLRNVPAFNSLLEFAANLADLKNSGNS